MGRERLKETTTVSELASRRSASKKDCPYILIAWVCYMWKPLSAQSGRRTTQHWKYKACCVPFYQLPAVFLGRRVSEIQRDRSNSLEGGQGHNLPVLPSKPMP